MRRVLMPPALGSGLSALFPRAELVSVEGAHHNDPWSLPEVHERIARFLAP